VNSVFVAVSSSGDGPGDRPKNDGRLRVLLRRRICNDVEGWFPEFAGDDDSTSVCERCTRPGRARGPPGTDGALVICTGRGLGNDVRLCLADRVLDRVSFSVGLLMSFLRVVLAFRPREESRPAVTLAPTESDGECDNCAPNAVLVLRELIGGWTPASAGYGKAGGGTFGDGTVSMSR
jgi:hypothetical protein